MSGIITKVRKLTEIAIFSKILRKMGNFIISHKKWIRPNTMNAQVSEFHIKVFIEIQNFFILKISKILTKKFSKIFSEKCQSDLTFYCDHVDPNGVKCDYSTQIKRHLVTHKVWKWSFSTLNFHQASVHCFSYQKWTKKTVFELGTPQSMAHRAYKHIWYKILLTMNGKNRHFWPKIAI